MHSTMRNPEYDPNAPKNLRRPSLQHYGYETQILLVEEVDQPDLARSEPNPRTWYSRKRKEKQKSAETIVET